MFNHKDTLRTSSWQMQVSGRKKWHLCDNTESPLIGKAGDIDFFQPDYNYYENIWKLECIVVVVGPGDFIYYPKDYWHQTLALDTPTVSISGNL
jgi:ribosomal protein L16 Arg81 hydroxylase